MKNIELKVSLDKFDDIIAALKKIVAKHMGVLHQVDTYYKVKSGRLKIREINDHQFERIYYQRPNQSRSKISIYRITKLKKEQVDSLKANLEKKLGRVNVVEKDRDLWIYKNTRIHLDNVKHLGKFLELETVVKNGNMNQFRKEHAEVINFLQLSKCKKYKQSYCELLSDNDRSRPVSVKVH